MFKNWRSKGLNPSPSASGAVSSNQSDAPGLHGSEDEDSESSDQDQKASEAGVAAPGGGGDPETAEGSSSTSGSSPDGAEEYD